VLGWSVAHDGNPGYEVFTTGDADGVHGGLFDTEGKLPSYAVFSVIVEDVAATCRRAEEAGGKVQRAPQVNPDGLTFAHLLDPKPRRLVALAIGSANSQPVSPTPKATSPGRASPRRPSAWGVSVVSSPQRNTITIGRR
jgi:predicted enzyme related to lactoylglutathione lyase